MVSGDVPVGDAVKAQDWELDCKYKPQFNQQPIVFCPNERRSVKAGIWCCPTLKTCGLLILAIFFTINLVAFVVMWGTNTIENSIIKDMVIKNNTKTYDWWVKPPIQPYMQVRVFNYTNVERFLAGDDEKLRVEEAGPYTYRETLERVNVEFHFNGTVSYQEKRSFEFIPGRSLGRLDDVLVVPNMVFLSSASIMKNQNYLARLSMSGLYRTLDVEPFLTLSARDIFWGYNDTLFKVGQSLMAFKGIKGVKGDEQKIGLLVARNGTSSKRISIFTGVDDITKLGVIDRYADRSLMNVWETDECNRLDGTDGSMFPPHLMDEDSVLHMYMKDMCRKFPLVFKEYVQTDSGVRAMRFHPPRSVFATGKTHPQNACFCHADSDCPPAGVFNSSPCAFNAPIMMSFPHFFLGDASLVEQVDGLSPDPAKHDMYMDLHPKFGFPMAGESRFQVNIMIRKSFGISHLERFEDQTILPMAWFEVVVDEMPAEVETVLKELVFVTQTAKRIVTFTFFATLIIVLIVAVNHVVTGYNNRRKESY